MPSPLAHIAVGSLLCKKSGRAAIDPRGGRGLVVFQALIIIGLSFLPDLDSAPGFFFKDLGRFHNNFSHSLLFGLGVSLLVYLVAFICRVRKPGHWFVIALVSYWLHILMDYLSPGRGLMLFWPFTEQRYLSPVTLFYGLHWSEGLVSIEHVWTILTESLFVAFLMLAWYFSTGIKRAETPARRKRAILGFVGVVGVAVCFILLAVAWSRTGGIQLRVHPGTDPLASSIAALTDHQVKAVWVRDCETLKDAYALGGDLQLVGYDSADGAGESVLVPGPESIIRPIISPDGRFVFFSDRLSRQVFRIHWDGSGRTLFAKGRTLDAWHDPQTGRDWIYIGGADTDHPRYHKTVWRYDVEDSSVVELVCDRYEINENNFQVSGDGRHASADVRNRGMGVIDLETGTYTDKAGGCWPSLSPDESGLFWCLGDGHRVLLMVNPKGDRWRVPVNQAPGVDGFEVFHPRWSNHPRFITLSGPYKEGLDFDRIKNGGPAVDIYLGKFNTDFTAIEGWVRLSHSDGADFAPDVWVQQQDER
ncbi:MAG: metal-dependent hydrolase [Spartobacteria bacterium]|nr:metal-dependent hydrolase [Spartobacteria bacterium]